MPDSNFVRSQLHIFFWLSELFFFVSSAVFFSTLFYLLGHVIVLFLPWVLFSHDVILTQHIIDVTTFRTESCGQLLDTKIEVMSTRVLYASNANNKLRNSVLSYLERSSAYAQDAKKINLDSNCVKLLD